MNIEFLYPETCNLFGDSANITYLTKCLKDANIVETSLNEEPYFVNHDVDFIYMGSMSERMQEIVISKLMPYKDRLKELIDNNVPILFTGNALEVLGSYIEKDDNSKIEGLNIFNMHAKREMLNRKNSTILGTYNNMDMIGYRSTFTTLYLDFNSPFITIKKGEGMNKSINYEGIKVNNFIGTYLLGPILIMNPYFTKELLKTITKNEVTLLYEEELIDAYKTKLNSF